ncbi:MAG: single-stranded DNA-binding protein [Ignavibacteria bacterium]|jgi:single-strand DNA-binding protein|nr:single-stranded DNA-binding protein [Ignavibacteria bacterium]
MAFSLNKIQLIGNLGRDAETRFTTNSNTAITSFSVATTHGYKGKDGNWENETTWHNVIAFSLSDFYKESLKKGAKVFVEGRLSKRDYTDKDGIKRYSTEVVCEKIIPLDSRDGSYSSGSSSSKASDEQFSGEPVQEDDLPF